MVTQAPEYGKTVSLKVVAAAITKIESIRSLEHSCEVLGVQVTLRPLQPELEVEVQEFVALAWREGRDEKASFADFMDRLRIATLSHSLVQIGDVDLRGVEYLQTDELDDNGNPIILPKQDALRQMLAMEWSRPMLTQVFAQYGQLLDKLDARAGSAVTYDPVDLDTEIERLERRLADLRSAKEKADKPSLDVVQQRQRAVLDAQSPTHQAPKRNPAADAQVLADDALAQDERKPSPPAAPAPAPSPATPPPSAPPSAAQASPPGTRRSAVPAAAQAPSAPPREPEKVELEIDAEMAPAHPASAELEIDERGQTMPLGGDSFFDPADPDAALAMETRRQAQLIRESRQRSQDQATRAAQRAEMGLPDAREATRAAARSSGAPRAAASLDPVTGSLRAAANTSNAVLDAGAGAVRSGRPSVRPTGGAPGVPAQLHGKPVYQTPTQVLDRSVRAEPPVAPPPSVNQEGGGRNPRFKPPGSM